ncbi:MAG: sigma 54-interacting transcriptional regulator [Myxococcota bacterium]|jgi:transcriptional regulator with GAF, ATPase, and Fis domain|nr:sigma 54-interacting transcriptional regulator [Myxococcota bacterium]
MPSLTVRLASGKTRSHAVFKKVTSIGSAEDNDLRIEGKGVLSTHALLHFDGKAFNLQALDRKHPIEVNGKRRSEHALSHRDSLLIGDVEVTFLLYDERMREDDEVAQEQLEAYKKIHAFSCELAQNHRVPVLLESLMDHVVSLTQADKGFLILVEGGTLDVKVARNLKRETILDAEGQLSDSIVEKALRMKQAIIVSDALNDKEFNSSHSVMQLKLCSVMCVPLLDKGTLLGLIYVGNDNIVNLFEQKHLDLLVVFAAQASLLVANALLLDDLQIRNRSLQEQLESIRFGSIIGNCLPMRDVYRRVEKIAATDVTVLIQGQTGTGKELIAREVHNRSHRSKGPFITINCGAIPENLLESELFGHVRGAFTGASATKPGKFQLADGGTLFLDEVAEMPLNLQVKLLRVLQEREVSKVGGTKPEYVDIRVIAATNKDLEQLVKQNLFREDLFYRLNVVMLSLPPLCERGDDILLIAHYLLDRYCKEFGVTPKRISREAAVAMRKYPWPGNIRQLENRLKKAAILSDRAMLSPEDLDLMPEVLGPIATLADAKEDFQRRYINEILELNNGNRTKTARDLGVDPRTIFRHLEKESERTG